VERPSYGQRVPRVQKSGYVREYAPEHPLADKLGLVMQHRRVVYDAGIELPIGAVVHHRNGDRADNRLENLEVLRSHKAHAAHHIGERSEIQNQYGMWPIGRLVATSVKVPKELHDAWKAKSKAENRTMADIGRAALAEYLG